MKGFASLCLTVASACAGANAGTGDRDGAPSDDDAQPPDGSGSGCDLSAEFADPQLVPGINTESSESYAWLSADELTLYLTTDRAGGAGNNDLWVATRSARDTAFATPTLLPISTAANEMRATLTADELQLFAFVNSEADPDSDIVVARRGSTSAPFGAFEPIPVLTTDWLDEDPCVDASGTTLYFASLRDQSSALYRTTRASASAPFETPTRIVELDTADYEYSPVVSADGLEIVFSADRPGGPGQMDLWTARRGATSEAFGEQHRAAVSGTTTEWPVWISSDRCRLYFVATDRAGGLGSRDVWVASRPPR